MKKSVLSILIIFSSVIVSNAKTLTIGGKNIASDCFLPPITITESHTNVTCNGYCDAIIVITPSGGVTPYTFLGPTGPFCAGTHTFVVTDAVGQVATISVTITEPPLLTLSISSVPASCGSCCDGAETALAAGGTAPYTFSWWPGGSMMPGILGLCPGTYICCVTDANGCQTCGSDTLSFATAMSEMERLESILIFPNPFSESTTFEIQSINLNKMYSFELTDVLGKKVKSISGISEKQFTFSRNGLESGIYFYKIQTKNDVVGIGKVIIK